MYKQARMGVTQSVRLPLEGSLWRRLGSNAQTAQKGPALPRRLRTGPRPICAAEHRWPLPNRPALLPKASHPSWPLRQGQCNFTTACSMSMSMACQRKSCIFPSCLAYCRSAQRWPQLSQHVQSHAMPHTMALVPGLCKQPLALAVWSAQQPGASSRQRCHAMRHTEKVVLSLALLAPRCMTAQV